MPLSLLKHGLSKSYPGERHFGSPGELKPVYDVVIIGGGGHDLANAYYLDAGWGTWGFKATPICGKPWPS